MRDREIFWGVRGTNKEALGDLERDGKVVTIKGCAGWREGGNRLIRPEIASVLVPGYWQEVAG